MPLPTIPSGNVASALPSGYDINNSCMFDRDDEHYMVRTYGTATNTKIFTYSFWIKRTASHSNGMYVFENVGSYGGENPQGSIFFDGSDKFGVFEDTYGSGSGLYVKTNRVFRDFSGWYHIVLAIDSTQSTDTNRVKIYVNGTHETSLANSTYPAQDHTLPVISGSGNPVQIGKYNNSNSNLTGYLAEVVFIDGQQLTASDFGEYDDDSPKIWKPKDVSGLTFGNNGYYLDFADSGDLGDDESGNGNDFTENNLAATDQSLDTPTNNFCTINPNDNYYAGATITQGALKFQHGSTPWTFNTGTFGVSSGKWYWELTVIDAGSSGGGLQPTFGIANRPPESNAIAIGNRIYDYGYRSYQQNVISNGSEVLGSLNSFTDNDVMGVYLDLDNNKLYFSKNGTLENSTGISITDPASTHSGFYFPAAGDNTSSAQTTWQANFGAPLHTISSGNADDNGYGNFEYSPNITGDSEAKKFYALCTKNLAEFGG